MNNIPVYLQMNDNIFFSSPLITTHNLCLRMYKFDSLYFVDQDRWVISFLSIPRIQGSKS
ncbi:hypothetical protein HanIR_Chr14g0694961 [Helianthus annuus]|nr:hypothetical protein HanIR_Chr14g0694961 [Helianthus annuus]